MKIAEWLHRNIYPYVIAEVSQNHDGSLGQAHAFIDAVKMTGADAIKFQTHFADEESSKYEPFRVKFSYEDDTRYDYWKRMEFTEGQWKGLYDHAMEAGLEFLSSPFSLKALNILNDIGVTAWKFGAGEVFHEELLDAAIRTGKPILLSTGLSTYDDIDRQIEKVRNNGNPVILFQCVTAYPSAADMIDISLIEKFIERYGCVVGISDHSSTIYPSLAAVTLGAKAVEVHVTMSPHMFGPDVKASVTLDRLKDIVEGVHFIADMLQCHTDLSARDESRENLKKVFSKSLFARADIAEGICVTEDMLIAKKPDIGVPADRKKYIVGKKVKRWIGSGEPLQMEDLI